MIFVDRAVPGSAGGRLPGHPKQQAVSRPTLGGPAFLRAHLFGRVLGGCVGASPAQHSNGCG